MPKNRKISTMRSLFPLLMCLKLVDCFTTAPLAYGMCRDGENVYENGESIFKSSDGCYSVYCDNGDIIHADHQCFFSTPVCKGVQVPIPGQCCPECITTTSPITPSPTTTPHNLCIRDGKRYAKGEDVPSDDPCEHCVCAEKGEVLCAQANCGLLRCVNPKKDKGKCCPYCPDGPSCWFGKKLVLAGKTYYPKKNIACMCTAPWSPFAKCTKIPKNKYRKLLKRFGDFLYTHANRK